MNTALLKLVAFLLLVASFPMHASTVAYWKFGVGPANTIVQTETNDYVFSADLSDVSGNGNHLSAWNDTPNSTSLWYRDNLAFSAVPQTGQANEFSLQNYGIRACTFTQSSDSNPSGIDAEAITPAQFTVEAVFNPEDTQNPLGPTAIGTIVNRDAYGIYTSVPGTSSFSLRVREDFSLEAYFVDVFGYLHSVRTAANTVVGFDRSTDSTGLAGTWYHVAAVSDGSSLKLYLTNITDEGDSEVVADLDLTLSGSPDTSLSKANNLRTTWHGGSWVVFRGLYNDGHGYRYQGLIDEVRISDAALTPIDFMCNAVLLSERLEVESACSAYLNNNTAVLAFQCLSVNDISVELTFRDHLSGTSPVSPMEVMVRASQGLQEETIDIANWPDGDYEVLIEELREDSLDTGTLVRAIRKQTIASPQNPNEPIDVAGRTMLFVDDWYVDFQSELDREVEQGQIIPIEYWQVNPAYFRYDTWVTDFWIGQDQKMYVHLHARNGKDVNGDSQDELDYWVVSDDYENWSIVAEPSDRDGSFRIISFDKTKVKNLFTGTPSYGYYNEQEDGPVNLSQVSVYSSGYEGIVLGDIPIPARSRIAVWERPDGDYLILTPDPIVTDKWEFDPNEIGEWRDTNDNFGPEHLSMDGNTLRFYQTRSIPRNDPFRVYYDNILVSRIMIVWSSQDGVNWTPTYFDVPDEDEALGLQHYGVYIFNEEENDLELSYVRMFDQVAQLTYTDLAYSRDGLQWNRFSREHFLDNGEFGSWNFGFTYASSTRMRLDNGSEYFEPIVGINVPHFMFISVVNKKDRSYVTETYYSNKYDGRLYDEETGLPSSNIWDWYDSSWDIIVDETKDMVTTPGLVKYRKDGWVWLGNTNGSGAMTTKILSAGVTLNINAKTDPNGFILVEVLDQYGNDLPGYSGSSGATFSGDSVDFLLCWDGGSITELPYQPIKLRVTINKGKLYSFNFGGHNKVMYVDSDATGQNDGSSWSNAFCDLQDALANAEDGDQIWVAEGVYKPTQDVNNVLACYEAFELKSGVAIYGGFAGTETCLSERDYENNEAILSGDLTSNDGPNFANNDENSRHVVIGEDTDETAILDGFTIKGGNANNTDSPHNAGGGLIVWATGSPTIQNCRFIGNSSKLYGGAIYAGESSIKIKGCRFQGNISRSGGAIRLHYSNCVEIDDSVFIENGGDTATIDTRYGGAISNWGTSSLVITNCYFIGNQTTLGLTNVAYGGAIVMGESGTTDVLNCVFNGNQSDRGGAIRVDANISNIVNCTFVGNTATIAGRAIALDTSSDIARTVSNSILWDSGNEISYSAGLFSIEYSDIYGSWSGEGNVNLDPSFADPDGVDNIGGTEDDNCRLTVLSPCIDRGNNENIPSNLLMDIDGYHRIANTTVDMGAYEYGSTMYLSLDICGDMLHPIPPGDITEDCRVDIEDMVALAMNWLFFSASDLSVCGDMLHPIPQGDITEDCRVDIEDMAALAADWLVCTAPECDS